MKVLGFVNRYSRGVQAVQNELRNNGNGYADFKLHLDTAFLVIEKIANKEANKEPNKEKQIKRQIEKICDMIKENSASTYDDFMNALGISYSSVYERVKFLKQKGVVSREGGLYGGKWIINEERYSQLYPSLNITH